MVIPKSKKKKAEEELVTPPVEETEPAISAVTEEPETEPVEEDDESRVIENIKAEKIEGPKILGKIQLPAEGDQKPKSIDEKESASEFL